MEFFANSPSDLQEVMALTDDLRNKILSLPSTDLRPLTLGICSSYGQDYVIKFKGISPDITINFRNSTSNDNGTDMDGIAANGIGSLIIGAFRSMLGGKYPLRGLGIEVLGAGTELTNYTSAVSALAKKQEEAYGGSLEYFIGEINSEMNGVTILFTAVQVTILIYLTAVTE